MHEAPVTLTLVLAAAAGVVAQSAARHLHIPGIVVLLACGALLGPDVLAWVDPSSLGAGLLPAVDLAVAVILFEGGLNLELSRLRRSQLSIRRLVTWGALVTLVGGAVCVRLLLDWPWLQSLLFGSLVVVTGPTVIGPLVSDLRLRPRVATVLEAEGVLIDPIGAILAVLALELALAPGAGTVASGGAQLVARLGFGAAAGIAGGLALAFALRTPRLVPEGFGNVFALASVLLLFEGADQLVAHTGIVAVPIAGVVVGNARTRIDRDLREFKDQLTVLLIGLLFVLLAADVRIADVAALGWDAGLVLAALVLVVRPLGVWLSTLGSRLDARERLLLAWIAPRGIVAAAVASLAASALAARGLEGGIELRALVFLVIAGTVLLAGLTGRPVASLLRQRLPRRETVAILGAQGLGLALGRELRRAGQPVVFLDSNPLNCRKAEEEGFGVVFGDALQERTLQRARMEGVARAIGLTPNDSLNSLFVSRVQERFGVPIGHVAVGWLRTGVASEKRGAKASILFEDQHDVERWDVRWRHGDVEIEYWERERERERTQPTDASQAEESEGLPKEGGWGSAERFCVLTLQRGGRTDPMSAQRAPRPGDRVAVAIYAPERELAHARLRELGFRPGPAPEAAEVAPESGVVDGLEAEA